MTRFLYLLAATALYILLSYVPYFNYVTLVVEMFCTFLHEFGHAFFAFITGGHVHSLQVNMDGSGVTTTSGGNRALTLMGGYVGSAIFGNLMLRCVTANRSKVALIILTSCMIMSTVLWFSTFENALFLLAFAIVLFIVSKTSISTFVMSFLGIASIIYIIQDFNVGPSSDLEAYENVVGFFPASLWMYIWLIIVVFITVFNIYHLYKLRE